MLMSVKCKKCNNHYPLGDINQHTAQCEKEELTEKVSAHGKEHNTHCHMYRVHLVTRRLKKLLT